MSDAIYLDHAATAPVDPQVRDAMLPYLGEGFANPSSIHKAGRLIRRAVNEARSSVAELLRAPPETIVFTGGGTEADALAIWGAALAREEKGERGYIHDPSSQTTSINTLMELPTGLHTKRSLHANGTQNGHHDHSNLS